MARSFDKFNKILDYYMPPRGEGDTMANQIATAVAKIAYRWFNDGDTVSSDWMVAGETIAGGLSQFANWLYENVKESRPMFNDWLEKFNHNTVSNAEYETFLYDMCTNLLDLDLLDGYFSEEKRDTLYSKKWESGKFKPELDDDEY